VDDAAQEIDPDALHHPSGPPGDAVGFPSAVHQLSLVQDPAPRAAKGRHRISLDASTSDQPAQPATDRQDQDHKPSHAEAPVAPPGAFDGHLHTNSIESGQPVVDGFTSLIGSAPGLATFYVHLLREGHIGDSGEGRGAVEMARKFSRAGLAAGENGKILWPGGMLIMQGIRERHEIRVLHAFRG
jgi:hypothetical protein